MTRIGTDLDDHRRHPKFPHVGIGIASLCAGGHCPGSQVDTVDHGPGLLVGAVGKSAPIPLYYLVA